LTKLATLTESGLAVDFGLFVRQTTLSSLTNIYSQEAASAWRTHRALLWLIFLVLYIVILVCFVVEIHNWNNWS